MKEIILILVFYFILHSFCESQTLYQRAVGGTGNDTAYNIILTSDGGYALAGVTNSFGSGLNDFYLVKFNSIGSLQWSKTIGGTENDIAFSCVQTSDGGYAMTGETNSFGAGIYDFYIVKLTSNGAVQWNRTIGGNQYDYPWSIKQTSDGGFIVAGSTNSFGAGNDDIYVVKLDSNGTVQWNRTVGGANKDNAYTVTQTSDGGYIVGGRTSSFGQGGNDDYILKFGNYGTMLWGKTIGGSNEDHIGCIIQTFDGGYAGAGATTSFGAGDYDFYIVKFSSTGNLMWTRTVGGTGSDRSYWITQTSDSGLVISGWTNSFGVGGYDVYIVKLSGSGTLQWSRTIGDINNEYARAIVQTPDGGYMAAGITYSFGAGNNDFYIIKLNSSGNGCGITSSPSSTSGTGGVVTIPNPVVKSPTPLTTSPVPAIGSGGIITTSCLIGIKSISNEVPVKFSLSQNYPNPFNPKSNIKFQIAKPGDVKLVIFDVIGREVAVLVNEELQPGIYEVTWDANSYPSGVYFYRLITQDFSETKKMVLLK